MVFVEKGPEKFDVVVIGGGPAGMLAAWKAAESGAKVILIEKNRSLGKKLLLTGKGRCNLTCAIYDNREVIEKIGKKGKFLFEALKHFGPLKTVNFFEKRGLKLKEERGKRVFPVSDEASAVLDLLVKMLKEQRVSFKLGEKVSDFEVKDGKIECLRMENGEQVFGEKFILATGGKSYPVTGSTGDGYIWAEKMGHSIVPLFPSLTAVRTKEEWVKMAEGTSLKNVKLKVFEDEKKRAEFFGEMLFTHSGVSGPIVLLASREIGPALAAGKKIILEIDLKPAIEFNELDLRLQRDFKLKAHTDFKNYLPDLAPKSLGDLIMSLSTLAARKKLFEITREERRGLVKILKEMKLEVEELVGYELAVVTRGGVDLKEVDPKTMGSRKINNLFLAGEILDLDGPTGGYNLQICWSTGFLAGLSAAGVYNLK